MSGTDSDSTDQTAKQAAMPVSEAKVWFVQEILPLEALLTRFLRKNWRNPNDIEDLRQEIYAHVLKAAEAKVPDRAKAFLFATARNLLVDHLRRENIVPIEIVAELDIIAVPHRRSRPRTSSVRARYASQIAARAERSAAAMPRGGHPSAHRRPVPPGNCAAHGHFRTGSSEPCRSRHVCACRSFV